MDIQKLSVAAAALWAAATTAQAEMVGLPLDLPAKAAITVTIEKSRETAKGGKTEVGGAVLVYDVEAERQGDDAHLVSWTLKDARETGSTTNQADLVMKAPLIFTADGSLAPVRLENWDAVRAATFEVLARQPAASGSNEQALAGVKRMYDAFTPETAAQAFLKEASLISIAQNVELPLGEAVEYEEYAANPLGGPPVKMNASVLLESVDRKRNRAVVIWTNAFDPQSASESTQAAVKAMLSRLGPAASPEAARDIEQMSVQRADLCRYEVDLGSGLAALTECETRLAITAPGKGEQTRIDRMKATQTLAR